MSTPSGPERAGVVEGGDREEEVMEEEGGGAAKALLSGAVVSPRSSASPIIWSHGPGCEGVGEVGEATELSRWEGGEKKGGEGGVRSKESVIWAVERSVGGN